MARSLNEGSNAAGMIDGAAARRYIDRAKELLEHRDEITMDLKEVYAEAKEAGFVTARLRQRVKEERMEPEVLAAQKQYMEALEHALGEFGHTPLGVASLDAERRKGRRKSQAQTAVEAAQAHLDGGGDFEGAGAKIDADLDKIIGEPAGAA